MCILHYQKFEIMNALTLAAALGKAGAGKNPNVLIEVDGEFYHVARQIGKKGEFGILTLGEKFVAVEASKEETPEPTPPVQTPTPEPEVEKSEGSEGSDEGSDKDGESEEG